MDPLERQRALAALGVPQWRLRRPLAAEEVAPCPPVAAESAAEVDGQKSAVEAGDPPIVAPVAELKPESPTVGAVLEFVDADDEGPPPIDDDWIIDAEPVHDYGYLDVDEPPLPPESRVATLNWDELEAAVGACTACPLHASRTRPVFGVGNRQADWLIIGEAPGAEEDRRGEPFVGRAGKLLDAMLMALGLDRQSVYIANILKSRPPNNRDPKPEETDACWPFLARQIALIRPKIIIAVGRISAQRLLGSDAPVGRLRGKVHRLPGHDLPLVVTYHPAYLLRSPSEKSRAWDDLRLAWRTYRALENDA